MNPYSDIGGLVTLIFCPQSLFANKFEHNQFTVYYNKDYKYDAILKDQRTEEEVFNEMVQWMKESKREE